MLEEVIVGHMTIGVMLDQIRVTTDLDAIISIETTNRGIGRTEGDKILVVQVLMVRMVMSELRSVRLVGSVTLGSATGLRELVLFVTRWDTWLGIVPRRVIEMAEMTREMVETVSRMFRGCSFDD